MIRLRSDTIKYLSVSHYLSLNDLVVWRGYILEEKLTDDLAFETSLSFSI